ncbi:MAG: STAS domain-containing protein [Acidobacteria bacterium]|nr:STAS domain-containing protein [Acidobacteriota bacterium]
MKSNIQKHADVTVVSLQGKITIGEGDVRLRQCVNEVLEDGAKKIILDLQDVSYMDSSGVGELVASYTTISNRGAQLRLANLKPKIYSLLQLTALVTVFQIYDSTEDALQSLS